MADSTINDFSQSKSIPSATDVLPIVDNQVTPPTTKKITFNNLMKSTFPFSVIVAASNAPAIKKAMADYVCTGVNDDVIINQAIQAVVAAGGGKIQLTRGTFIVSNPVLLNAWDLWLEGEGTGTVIQQDKNINISTIISINGTNIAQIKVSNLHIEGNKTNNQYGNGITMQTPGASNSWVALENVVVYNCPNNGVTWNANSGSSSYYLNNIHVSGCNGNGFYSQFNNGVALTDSVFINCISDTNALNGFYLATLDTHFYGCKAYFNGSAGGSNHGFYLAGYNNYFHGCQAQDNYGCGFFLNNDGDSTYGTQNNVFDGCDADSNYNPSNSRGASSSNSPTGYGWYINNTTGTQLVNCQSYVRPYPFSWGQDIGVWLLGTTNGTYVIGLCGSGNTSSLYSDTSSGSNFPFMVQGVTNVLNGNLSSAFDITNTGNATIAGSGKNLGFYGVSAVARQTLATGASHTVDDVITALQNLGLVKQS